MLDVGERFTIENEEIPLQNFKESSDIEIRA